MKRILVIDDEEIFRKAVCNILRQSGYSVLEAGDGEKGLETLQNEHVSLVVSDVMMGRLDGYGLIDRIRMDPVTSTIPFIFMTGLSDKDSMRKGMTLGADDFLVKPFTGNELITAIEARLAKHSEMVENAERKLTQLRSSISLSLPHELRTPLASILGFAEIIGDDASALPATDIIRFGKLIHRSGLRLQRLLENFLIHAQIEVVAADPQKLSSLRRTCLSDAAGTIRTLSGTKALAYRRSPDLTLELLNGPVEMSSEYLTKICDELLDNAFKFSQAGTEVRVATTVSKGTFILSIADQGRGMTPDQIANVGAYVQFERGFFEQQGVGLGVVIAKRLIEIHGGKIEFVATAGGGLTVSVFLPIHRPE